MDDLAIASDLAAAREIHGLLLERIERYNRITYVDRLANKHKLTDNSHALAVASCVVQELTSLASEIEHSVNLALDSEEAEELDLKEIKDDNG